MAVQRALLSMHWFASRRSGAIALAAARVLLLLLGCGRCCSEEEDRNGHAEAGDRDPQAQPLAHSDCTTPTTPCPCPPRPLVGRLPSSGGQSSGTPSRQRLRLWECGRGCSAFRCACAAAGQLSLGRQGGGVHAGQVGAGCILHVRKPPPPTASAPVSSPFPLISSSLLRSCWWRRCAAARST